MGLRAGLRAAASRAVGEAVLVAATQQFPDTSRVAPSLYHSQIAPALDLLGPERLGLHPAAHAARRAWHSARAAALHAVSPRFTAGARHASCASEGEARAALSGRGGRMVRRSQPSTLIQLRARQHRSG